MPRDLSDYRFGGFFSYPRSFLGMEVGLHVARWQRSPFRGHPCPFRLDFDFSALTRFSSEIIFLTG